jgi:predicted dehydrogenase
MGILHSGIVNSLPGARVRAICEQEGYLVRAGRGLLSKSVSFYSDYLEMVEKEELDAVYVTTPISTHVSIVVDLAKTNRDVGLFVEKPLAASGATAQHACDAAKDLKGPHMVGYQKRFSPVFLKAREMIRRGDLGELMFFRSYIFSSDVLREGTAWRFSKASGGVLLDLAPHLLDLILWFFSEPETVETVKRRIYSRDVDDYVHATLLFRSGLTGYLDACWSMRGYRLPEVMIEVHGKNGTLTVTDDLVRFILARGNGKAGDENQLLYKQSFDNSVPFLLADPEYTKENQVFLASVEKKSLPECNFFEAAKVNQLIDRISA